MTTGAVTPCSLQILEQRKPIFSRHDHIRENQIEMLRLRQFQSFGRVVADRGLVPR